jgi:hypothetical protein
MVRRVSSPLIATFACAALAACDEPSGKEIEAASSTTRDPIVARALMDPLMTDPDLASRSEANAVLTYRDAHPLPPLVRHEDAARRAREAARLELLEGGQIGPLPQLSPGEGSAALGRLTYAGDMMRAVGAREECAGRLDGSLEWSLRLIEPAGIMPHGMVQEAAGVETGNCMVRVVRYLTPVDVADTLEYHVTIAARAGFDIEHFEKPEVQLRGDRDDQALAVHMREGPGGLTEVDIVHWRK